MQEQEPKLVVRARGIPTDLRQRVQESPTDQQLALEHALALALALVLVTVTAHGHLVSRT